MIRIRAAEPGHPPDPALTWEPGPDAGPDPELGLPADPFPDWHLFLSMDPFAGAEPDDPGWPSTVDDAFPESFLVPRV